MLGHTTSRRTMFISASASDSVVIDFSYSDRMFRGHLEFAAMLHLAPSVRITMVAPGFGSPRPFEGLTMAT